MSSRQRGLSKLKLFIPFLGVTLILSAVSDPSSQELNKDSLASDAGDEALGYMYTRLWHYFGMENPQNAARLILNEARDRSVDIDRVPPYAPPPRTVEFPSGVVDPIDSPKEFFVEKVSSLPEYLSVNDVGIMCVIKRSRRLSIREAAHILSLGVKIYDDGPAYCYIASVPVSQVPALVKLKYIVWISEFRSGYKYDQNEKFEPGVPFVVVSIIDDSTDLRADLRSLGARVTWQKYRYFVVTMAPLDIDALASLWWVKKIGVSNSIKVEDAENRSVDKAPTDYCQTVNFNTEDSRKLVSAGYGNEFGSNQLIGIVENGCDWNHPDLLSKFELDVSDCSAKLYRICKSNIISLLCYGVIGRLKPATQDGSGWWFGRAPWRRCRSGVWGVAKTQYSRQSAEPIRGRSYCVLMGTATLRRFRKPSTCRSTGTQ
ncbi:MAG: hypothetical protein PVF33_11230 [Candidatus Latescibacterota bacterium]|jgi:hypothetical protein